MASIKVVTSLGTQEVAVPDDLGAFLCVLCVDVNGNVRPSKAVLLNPTTNAIGFFGSTSSTQPSVAAASLTLAADLATALSDLGLIVLT